MTTLDEYVVFLIDGTKKETLRWTSYQLRHGRGVGATFLSTLEQDQENIVYLTTHEIDGQGYTRSALFDRRRHDRLAELYDLVTFIDEDAARRRLKQTLGSGAASTGEFEPVPDR